MSHHWSKNLNEYIGKIQFDIVISVCSQVEGFCPVIPGAITQLHWPFEDPAAFEGSEEKKLLKFREVKVQIETRILSWLSERGLL